MTKLHEECIKLLDVQPREQATMIFDQFLNTLLGNIQEEMELKKGQRVVLDLLNTLLIHQTHESLHRRVVNRELLLERLLQFQIPWNVLPNLTAMFLDIHIDIKIAIVLGKKILNLLVKYPLVMPTWASSSLIKSALLFSQFSGSLIQEGLDMKETQANALMNTAVWIQVIRFLMKNVIEGYFKDDTDKAIVDPYLVFCVIDMHTLHSYKLAANLIKFYSKSIQSYETNNGPRFQDTIGFPLEIGAYDLSILSSFLKAPTCFDVFMKMIIELILSLQNLRNSNETLKQLICVPNLDSHPQNMLKIATQLCRLRSRKNELGHAYKEKSERALRIAQDIILLSYEHFENFRGEILGYCFTMLSEEACRIYGRIGGASNSRASGLTTLESFLCSTLETISAKFLPDLRSYAPQIQDWISYLPSSTSFSPGASLRILSTFLPLATILRSFKSNIIMLMKKFLASKSISSCALAHQCFSDLLKYDSKTIDDEEGLEIFDYLRRSLKLPLPIRQQLYKSLLELLSYMSNHTVKSFLLGSIEKLAIGQVHTILTDLGQLDVEKCYEKLQTNHVRASESVVHLVALLIAILNIDPNDQALNLVNTIKTTLLDVENFVKKHILDCDNEKVRSRLCVELKVSIFSPVYILLAESVLKSEEMDPAVALELLELRSGIIYVAKAHSIKKTSQQFKVNKFETILSVDSALAILETTSLEDKEISILLTSDLLSIFLAYIKLWEHHIAYIKSDGDRLHQTSKQWMPSVNDSKESLDECTIDNFKRAFLIAIATYQTIHKRDIEYSYCSPLLYWAKIFSNSSDASISELRSQLQDVALSVMQEVLIFIKKNFNDARQILESLLNECIKLLNVELKRHVSPSILVVMALLSNIQSIVSDGLIKLIHALIASNLDLNDYEKDLIDKVCTDLLKLCITSPKNSKSILTFIFENQSNISRSITLSCQIVYYILNIEDNTNDHSSDLSILAYDLMRSPDINTIDIFMTCMDLLGKFIQKNASKLDTWIQVIPDVSRISMVLKQACLNKLDTMKSLKPWVKVISVAYLIFHNHAKYIGQALKNASKAQLLVLSYCTSNYLFELCELSLVLRNSLQQLRIPFKQANIDKRIPSLISKMDVFVVSIRELSKISMERELKKSMNQTIKYLSDNMHEGIDIGSIPEIDIVPIKKRKTSRKSRLRSRNTYIDMELEFEDGQDDYADLEDFIDA